MPTRFVVNDFDLKDVKEDNIKTLEARAALKKTWKTNLTNQYRNLPDPKTNDKAGNIRFFYNKLRFWFKSLFKTSFTFFIINLALFLNLSA